MALVLFSLLFLFTFTGATPLPTDIALSATKLSTRQISNGVYYGDACDDLKGTMPKLYPNSCFLTLYQKKNFNLWTQNGEAYTWDTALYIFRTNCDLIGYVPGGLNLEHTWHSVASQLPYTVDIQTNSNVPEFKYAGQHYKETSKGGYSEEWNENDSGIDAHMWRLMFDC